MADSAQWFDSLGACCGCGKAATGKLMGTHNQSLGSHCKRCADKRIAKARKERAAEPPHPAAVHLASLSVPK